MALLFTALLMVVLAALPYGDTLSLCVSSRGDVLSASSWFSISVSACSLIDPPPLSVGYSLSLPVICMNFPSATHDLEREGIILWSP